MNYPTNTDDMIDSRDVIEAIEEIESELEDTPVVITESDAVDRAELVYRLTDLKAFAGEGESLREWQDGETLVRDSYFEDYARELADIGAIARKAPWPLTHIDWTAAADELKQDYTSVEFDGVTYWGRS